MRSAEPIEEMRGEIARLTARVEQLEVGRALPVGPEPVARGALAVAREAESRLGLALDGVHYRLAALCLSALAFARLFLHDLRALSAGPRIASFLGAGALLLAVSFVYTRRDRPPPP